jgi:hypothetical protein
MRRAVPDAPPRARQLPLTIERVITSALAIATSTRRRLPRTATPRSVSAAILAIVHALGRPAAAGASPDRVQWQAPPSCPTDAELEQALEATIPDSAPYARIEAVVAQEGSSWRVHVITHLGHTEQHRRIVASDCESLVRATVTIIATAYDDIVTAQRRVQQSATGAQPETRPAAPARRTTRFAPPPPRTTHTAVRRHRWLARVDLGYATGTSPRGTFGVGLAFGWQRRLFRAEILGRWFIPQPLSRMGVTWAEVHGGTAAALACAMPRFGRVQVPLCAGIEGGGVRAEGREIMNARGGAVPWGAGLARAGLSVRLWPRLAIVLGAELAVPWTRIDVRGGAAGRFFLPDVAARAMLGIETRLGRDGNPPRRR